MIDPTDPSVLRAGKPLDETMLSRFSVARAENGEINRPDMIAPQAFVGRPRFYTYSNLGRSKDDFATSCGHACIASMHDYFDRIDLPSALRTAPPGKGFGDDGRRHFENDFLVGKVFDHYPPVTLVHIPGLVNFRFTIRETIQDAMHAVGLKTLETYPPMFGSKEERFSQSKSWLMSALKMTGHPVIALVDLKYLDSDAFHWGMVIGADDSHVWMASWHTVYRYDWNVFAKAWHCEALPYPNNFYALYVG